ncbi:MAG TPA: DUF2958 domain-containing protein [Thermoanaerobaculia bacterium]|nr:DUF2958 domain-containing protein [Thermoanaerobaculia bacterium]
MDLVPSEVRDAFARFPIGSQDGGGKDAVVVVKYFFPAGRYTLYVTEARREGTDWLFFGWCVSMFDADCDEWGYTTLTELLSVNVRGLTIERDLHFPIATCTVRQALSRSHAA